MEQRSKQAKLMQNAPSKRPTPTLQASKNEGRTTLPEQRSQQATTKATRTLNAPNVTSKRKRTTTLPASDNENNEEQKENEERPQQSKRKQQNNNAPKNKHSA